MTAFSKYDKRYLKINTLRKVIMNMDKNGISFDIISKFVGFIF